MQSFFAYTRIRNPGLHLWREGTSVRMSLRPTATSPASGWVEFQCQLNAETREQVRFMLFSFNDDGSPGEFESNDFQRTLPRVDSGDFPEAVWFASGASRVVLQDPRQTSQATLRIHLISQRRFRPGELYLWDPVAGTDRRVPQAGLDALGPFFDLTLPPEGGRHFNFKFIRVQNGEFEPDFANRWWVADDGPEIWTHSGTAAITPHVPETRRLTLHYSQNLSSPATLRLWTENGDYETDVEATITDGDWTSYQTDLITHLPYAALFFNRGLPQDSQWEHSEAKRTAIALTTDTEWWTLEGDRALFDAPPTPSVTLHLQIANSALSRLQDSVQAHVWVNRARGPLATNVVADNNGRFSLQVFPDVTTSVKFHDDGGRWEQIERHPIRLTDADSPASRFVVLERPPLLKAAPPADLVQDPPFTIRRPGAYAEGNELRFVLHAAQAADVSLVGEWTSWMAEPVPMRSTFDGTYWWGSVPLASLLANLGDGRSDYHGVKYQYLFNQESRLQDPAAGWVEHSRTNAASRLVRQDRFEWHDQHWDRPGWESLIIYQIHPARLTNRFQDDPPLMRVAREIAENSGYFRELGVTAVQLMPVNEVGSTNSWGYDPAYFYAIENDYCGTNGPDDLKFLVDTCHRCGLAVLLDVVFNHAGGDDNILWHVARDSFFDGDTAWGAMINFDHPQCRHFFAQNLVYLAREFHIDGFRLDHTATIVHSAARNQWSGYVREPGTGGGWAFLHALRHAVAAQVGRNCILMAEHLPNEWPLTNLGGPMDSQWCDDFHDRLVDACRRQSGMSRLASALQLSQTACDNWYHVVNYPESHDEVGNVRDRVAYVAGYGQGWRMSKVAGAAALLSRGIPLFFMGAESGEDLQFGFGSSQSLNLAGYLANSDRKRIRAWWRELCWLHRDQSIQGPAPLQVCFADGQLLAFTRGANGDFFIVLNFGGWAGWKGLSELNLPSAAYRELWNSTWPAFAIHSENEGEHTNGGRDRWLTRENALQIPDYGAVILQRR